MIDFCPDSAHALAGKTVPMVELSTVGLGECKHDLPWP
jgi:hypothetical protein